jgi:hypothetical protein
MRQGCGGDYVPVCGEENKAQALNLCKDGILTGRGLHKFPLPPKSAAPPCSQSQLCQHFALGATLPITNPSLLRLFPDA